MSEQECVCQLQIEYLKAQWHISISFDGGTLRSGKSLYMIHATTVTRDMMLLEGQDGTCESHTGIWIEELVLWVSYYPFPNSDQYPSYCGFAQTIAEIGKEHIGSVTSDNVGNTWVAWEKICSSLPHILNLPDPAHHLNNTWKDIASPQ